MRARNIARLKAEGVEEFQIDTAFERFFVQSDYDAAATLRRGKASPSGAFFE